MKKYLVILAAALVCVPAVFAQNATCNTAAVPVCGAGSPAGDAQIKPQAVPTSTTVVTTSDAYLKGFTVNNPTAGAITFTLADRQGSPLQAVGPVSIAAGTTYIIVWPEGRPYWAPGGFTILAGGAGLVIQGSWKQ